MLQLKKIQKIVLFSLLFSECFLLYTEKPTVAKAPPLGVLYHIYAFMLGDEREKKKPVLWVDGPIK